MSGKASRSSSTAFARGAWGMEPSDQARADIWHSWQHRKRAVVVWPREADKLSILEVNQKPHLGKEIRTEDGTRHLGDDELVRDFEGVKHQGKLLSAKSPD